ncbi:hypothetical protein FQN49_002420 [Arthroderma sp. PD_2]|nr:hypothetical protein FQN49_002420 [Arthroderma sp. PD_2]
MTIDKISKGDVPHTQFYDSAYMSEALDSAFDIEHDGFDDGNLYWKILQELLRENRSHQSHLDRTVVLDVGAGSGRIFRKIAQKAAKTADDLSDVRFIGLDKSPAMLERAKKRDSELSNVGTVSWVVGDANNLISQPSLREVERQVSLILYADGGIGYLEGKADIHAFFLHTAQLLCPRSGRAHISLLEFQVAEAYNNGVIPSVYDESMESMDEISKDTSLSFKNVFYNEYVEDGHHLAQLDVEIIQTNKEGKETLLEVCHYQHRFRIWRTEELIQVAEEAGLQHVETINWPRMQHFVFMAREQK